MNRSLLLLLLAPALVSAQSESWSRYQEGRRLEAAYRQAANLDVQWSKDSKAFRINNGPWQETASGKAIQEAPERHAAPALPPVSTRGQAITAPGGSHRLELQGGALKLVNPASGEAQVVMEAPSAGSRITIGRTPWVYAEELSQTAGMGWSPDGKRFWFYRFDATPVRDYFVLEDQLRLQNEARALDYPRAGTPNHLVEIWVGNVEGKPPVKIANAPAEGWEYLWDVRWLRADALSFVRMDRLHQVAEVVLHNPVAGQTSVAHREQVKGGFLPWLWRPVWRDDQLFIPSEESGAYRWKRYDWRAKKAVDVAEHPYDIEFGGIRWTGPNAMLALARGGEHWMSHQLVRFDYRTRRATPMTAPGLHHRVSVSPNGEWFVGAGQLPGQAPEPKLFRVADRGAREIRRLAMAAVPLLPAPPVELFTFPSADGRTPLAGLLYFPRGFDPQKKYPVLFDIYLGPERSDFDLDFSPYKALTEFGFLVVQAEARGALGRGPAFRAAVHRQLGVAEVDDLAACAKLLAERPYVDASRVGVFGTSYGGYASLMALLRHPEVFHAASASSPVTDWRHYDTIYTERYMGLPKDQEAAYNAGNAITHAANLKGKLQLYFGTSDDNVHPSHSLMLIRALDQAGKDYELRVGPDRGHTFVGDRQMISFFLRALKPDPPVTEQRQ